MTTTNYDPRILKAPHPVPGAPDNWKRFFSFNTDAKVIGIQYIATSLFFLLGWSKSSSARADTLLEPLWPVSRALPSRNFLWSLARLVSMSA